MSIDQGGCIEMARATTHAHPLDVLHGVVHYCVAKMPAAVPRILTLAAVKVNAGLGAGVNTYRGVVTHAAVAQAQKRQYRALYELI